MLQAFQCNGAAFKGELAIPPGTHGEDLAYYFPTSEFTLILVDVPSNLTPHRTNGPPGFNNPSFIASFAESFEGMVMSLDPNNHPDASDVTPSWAPWTPNTTTEMLFNETTSGEPLIQPIMTDASLIQRCK